MLRQNGISASEQSDMLRLDAMVMMVQLNIRNLLEARPRQGPCPEALSACRDAVSASGVSSGKYSTHVSRAIAARDIPHATTRPLHS